MKSLCSYCGCKCSGNLQIRIFKTKCFPFCPNCFNLLQDLDTDLLKIVFKNNENFTIIE